MVLNPLVFYCTLTFRIWYRKVRQGTNLKTSTPTENKRTKAGDLDTLSHLGAGLQLHGRRAGEHSKEAG
jgi:hypothetical protein